LVLDDLDCLLDDFLDLNWHLHDEGGGFFDFDQFFFLDDLGNDLLDDELSGDFPVEGDNLLNGAVDDFKIIMPGPRPLGGPSH